MKSRLYPIPNHLPRGILDNSNMHKLDDLFAQLQLFAAKRIHLIRNNSTKTNFHILLEYD
jgi:hypothetical protein